MNKLENKSVSNRLELVKLQLIELSRVVWTAMMKKKNVVCQGL